MNISWFVESHGILSPTQCGFRKNHSTYDQLTLLENKIRIATNSNETCIVVFIDLTGAFDRVWHMGILEKLRQAGIKGRMLGWLRSYLNNRKFSVFVEGEESSTRPITSGVPQGAILSPLLFNIMLRDIPKVDGVTYSEYADDIAIYSTGINRALLISKLQEAINRFVEWANAWGQEVNPSKTKAMFFSKANLKPEPIRLNNLEVEYVDRYKFLGLNLDSPKLTFKTHINSLKSKCTKSLSILKFLSNVKWGSDRRTLDMLYKTLVRSRMDYACHLYGNACQTDLKSLDIIQNQCLRLILGAQSTSPIVSLEVESNVPPLMLRRKYLSAKYYYRISEYSSMNPVNKIFDYPNNRNTYLNKTRILFNDWRLPSPSFTSRDYTTFPPWYDIGYLICENFGISNVKLLSNQITQAAFNHLIESKYNNYTQIFTDGSKSSKTTSAFVIPSISLQNSYKLLDSASVLSSEILAIDAALKYLKSNPQIMNSVIFTDSYSSVTLLRNRKTREPIARGIITMLWELNINRNIFIQWIPGHQGIRGNEMADNAAKNPIILRNLEDNRLCNKDYVQSISRSLRNTWTIYWEQQVNDHHKGTALKSIKNTLCEWPWSHHKVRAVETALSRLRIGHVCLREHLFRFRLVDDPYCTCGEVESIDHFLLHCPLYLEIREQLKNEILMIDPNAAFNIKTILGGNENLVEAKQFKIAKAMTKFLIKTRKLYSL